ncbi:MAG: ABC transporter ATP-binding protein [Cytophagaceae bacterium]
MNTFLRLLSFARPFRRFLPKYLVFNVCAVIFGIVNFSFLIPLLNILFGTYEIPEDIIYPEFSLSIQYFIDLFNYFMYSVILEHGKMGALKYVCAIIITFVFLSNFFKYMTSRVINKVRTDMIYNLKKKLYSRIVGNDIAYFHEKKKGDILSVMSNDLQEVEYSLVSELQVIKEPLLFIGYFIFLFTISVKLTLLSLIILPVSGFVIGTIARNLRKQSQQSQLYLGSVLTLSEETLSGLKVIKAFNAQKAVNERFDKENNHLRGLVRSITNKRELASPLSEILGVMVAVTIIYVGSRFVFNDEISASEFITYIIIFSQVLNPAKAISHAITLIQRGLAAGDRVLSILDAEPKIVNAKNAVKVDYFNDSIEFKDVNFSFGTEAILKNINLKIEKGKKVALVGPSGGGKSTLVDLIPRFYDVQEGEVLLDGKSIKEIEIDSLRNLMGIVTQDPVLFNDTILNNIAFGIPGALREDVVQAAKIANAHNFIEQAENGYDTIIGDRGVKLSGGQRQRISIARAVLKNPPILILDEATSALDTESEKLVQDALNKLMKNRTSIVIAHRLSTILDADEIVVLRKGEILERGTHNELLAQGGLYTKLYAAASSMGA